MAAHIVTEFPVSDCKTVFTGTSEEDTANLKIFWKSIHLNPTIESRLVSSDVRQRIHQAPIRSHGSCSTSAKSTSSCSGSEKQKFKFREEDPSQLTEYHKNVFRLESEDQHMKRMDLLDQRADDLGRHKKRKDRREKVQKASSQRPITAEPLQILPPIPSEYNDDIDPEHEYMIELAEAMVDLDSFDDKHQLTYRVQGKQPVNEHALKLN